jgi:hypothetical protein
MVLLLLITLIIGSGRQGGAQTRGPHIQLLVDGVTVYDSGGPPATATPQPTREPTVAPTAATEPTATATSEPTATATPGHDTSLWHPPALGHHHGADPWQSDPRIVAFLEDNPVFAAIGHPWLSSPMENGFPDGKHSGFKFLAETDTGCEETVPGWLCVDSYLYQVHSTGIGAEWRVRIHSHKAVLVVCDADGTQCGIVATGGHADFGNPHDLYKQSICPLASNPPAGTGLHQPPYRVRGGAGPNIFWSSLHNPVTFQYYDPVPNRILQTAWIESDVWSLPVVGPGCVDPEQDEVTGGNQTTFQVFTFRLKIEDIPRPFEGFTDVYGNVDATCTEMGPNCVPLYVGADVPAGNVYFNRSVIAGDPAAAPIQTFPCPECVMPAHP